MSGLTTRSTAYKPFQFPWANQLTLKHEELHWLEQEANLIDDVSQWKDGTLSAEEKNHITQILRLFTQTDVEVANNYAQMFLATFVNNEIQSMLLSFGSREATHQRAYALLNDTLGFPDSEYEIFRTYTQMLEKIEFMQAGTYSKRTSASTIGLLLAQAVCNEGVALFSAFAMLLNYQRFGKMKGMCTIVEWSARDESLHADGMAELFREYCKEHPGIVNDAFKRDIYTNYTTAVALEDAVIDLSFEMGAIQGLTADEVKLFVRYMADRRLLQLGMKPIYHIETNPLPWIDWILSGDSFKNFFEGRVSDYAVNNIVGEWGWDD